MENIKTEQTKDLEQLLKNIQEGLKTYSIKDLNKAIIIVLNKKHDKAHEIEFILQTVSEQYDISVTMLKQSTSRGKVQEARQVCYCLLHNDLGLSIRHISDKIFFCWPTSVVSGLKKFKTLDLRIKKNKELQDAYEYIQKKLILYVTRKQ